MEDLALAAVLSGGMGAAVGASISWVLAHRTPPPPLVMSAVPEPVVPVTAPPPAPPMRPAPPAVPVPVATCRIRTYLGWHDERAVVHEHCGQLIAPDDDDLTWARAIVTTWH